MPKIGDCGSVFAAGFVTSLAQWGLPVWNVPPGPRRDGFQRSSTTPFCQAISKKSHTVAPRCTWRHRYDRSNVRMLSETSNLDYLHDAGRTSMEVCDDKALRAGICSWLRDSLVNCSGAATSHSSPNERRGTHQERDVGCAACGRTGRGHRCGRPGWEDADLRKGSNAFTCMPDNPATPGPDPMCMDQNALEWATAWIEHSRIHRKARSGSCICWRAALMPQHRPVCQKPDANNNWVETGPHVMLVGAKGMIEGYPRAAKPDTSQPYVMWPDTPYEHLMIPVQAVPATAQK